MHTRQSTAGGGVRLALLLIGHCVTSVAPFYKRPSLCEEPGEDIEEFFMNRLVRLSGKESDTALSLHEFNWYIPHIHTSKDKRQLAWIVDMTRYHNAALGMQDPSNHRFASIQSRERF
jgi:hypothetical protein